MPNRYCTWFPGRTHICVLYGVHQSDPCMVLCDDVMHGSCACDTSVRWAPDLVRSRQRSRAQLGLGQPTPHTNLMPYRSWVDSPRERFLEAWSISPDRLVDDDDFNLVGRRTPVGLDLPTAKSSRSLLLENPSRRNPEAPKCPYLARHCRRLMSQFWYLHGMGIVGARVYARLR